jgi:hypothetical protein
MSFIVVVELPRDGFTELRAFGPYRSFKRASGDAKAWNAVVLPIEKVEDGGSAADLEKVS